MSAAEPSVGTPIDPTTAPRQDYTCQEITLPFPAPFKEGHVCNAGEAESMNQTYRENLRNNFSKKCASMKKEGRTQEEIEEEFEKVVATYRLGARSGGGGRIVDPVLSIAIERVMKAVRDSLKRAGENPRDYSTAQIRAKAEKFLEEDPRAEAVMAQARATYESERETLDLIGPSD